jgi:hypothetical protein
MAYSLFTIFIVHYFVLSSSNPYQMHSTEGAIVAEASVKRDQSEKHRSIFPTGRWKRAVNDESANRDSAPVCGRCSDTPWAAPITISYDEAVDVGYCQFPQDSVKPLYVCGQEPSYTSFKLANCCDFWRWLLCQSKPLSG